MRLLEQLPKHVQEEIDGDSNISGHEFLGAPRTKDVEAVEEDDDGEEDEGEPGGVGLEGGLEDESVAVDALCLEGFVELDVGDADADPAEEGGDCGQVLEPGEDYVGAAGGAEIS